LLKSTVKRNYFYNLAYQVLLIIAPLVTVPYVSRVLGVTGVGRQSYTNSIVSYFVLIGSLGIGIYGQREIAYHREDKKRRSEIFVELFLFRLITTLLSLGIYSMLFLGEGVYRLLFAIQCVDIIASIFDVTWYFQGLENFKVVTSRNAIIKLLSIASLFIFIRKPADVPLYVVILSGTILISNISLFPIALRDLEAPDIGKIRIFSHLKGTIGLFLPQIAVQVYTMFNKTMIGLLTHSEYENGCYEQSQKIIKLLLTIVTSLGVVVVPRMAYLHSNGENAEIESAIRKSFHFVFALASPIVAGLIAIVPIFSPVFFGRGFEETIPLLMVQSLLLFAIGLNNVIGIQYLIPTHKENLFTVSVIIGALCNLVANIILIPSIGALGAAIGSVIAETAITVFQFFKAKKVINGRGILMDSWRYLLSSGILLVALYPLCRFLTPSMYSLLGCFSLGVGIYIAMLIILRDKYFVEMIKLLRKRGNR
jgi:Membrane protein involved in the export of O-antigen and teichoic acid